MTHNNDRPGKDGYALTIDSRFDDNLDLGLVEWFDLKKPTSRLEVTMLCRQVLQSKNSGANYRKALEAINNTGVIGPAYIIVSGTKSGEGTALSHRHLVHS